MAAAIVSTKGSLVGAGTKFSPSPSTSSCACRREELLRQVDYPLLQSLGAELALLGPVVDKLCNFSSWFSLALACVFSAAP